MADHSRGQESAIELVDGILSGVGLSSYRDVLSALELMSNPSMSCSRGNGESYIGWQKGDGLTASERLDNARTTLAKARGQS